SLAGRRNRMPASEARGGEPQGVSIHVGQVLYVAARFQRVKDAEPGGPGLTEALRQLGQAQALRDPEGFQNVQDLAHDGNVVAAGRARLAGSRHGCFTTRKFGFNFLRSWYWTR